MATKVYESATVYLLDGTELYVTPLKIKYLREFMALFTKVKEAEDDSEAIGRLAFCTLACMKQYYPVIKTIDQLEDVLDLPIMYKIIEFSSGVRINKTDDEQVVEQAQKSESGSSWEDLDLAKLEAEVFLIGRWKDYEDLESSLSMPELMATLSSKRELDYQEKKFLAAIQGVDLDKESGKADAWEEMKARVFSNGQASGSNDVLALQGANAAKAGFGIGNGLGYTNVSATGQQPFGPKK
jgi:hypothetical protein